MLWFKHGFVLWSNNSNFAEKKDPARDIFQEILKIGWTFILRDRAQMFLRDIK